MSDKNFRDSHNSRVYENFLMHWKYIKREKVNGKWKYTYNLPSNENSVKAEKVSVATRSVGKGSKYIDDEYQKELESNSQKNDFGNYKPLTGESLAGKTKQTVATVKKTIDSEYEKNLESNGQKNDFGNYKPLSGESLTSEIDYDKKAEEVKKTIDNQDKNGTKVTTKKNASSEYEKELAYNSQKNVYPEQTIKEKIIEEDVIPEKVVKEKVIEEQYVNENGNSTKSNKKSAKSEKLSDKIKKGVEKIADDLGFDEREEYLKAKQRYESAEEKRIKAERKADDTIKRFYDRLPTESSRQRLHDDVSSHTYWKEVSYERGKEYSAAKAEYYKTPIGRIAKFANSGREWLEDLFD